MSATKDKPATISKVLISEPESAKLSTEDGAENVIIPISKVRIIMENGSMFFVNLPSFGVSKDSVMKLYVEHPEVFKKLEQ